MARADWEARLNEIHAELERRNALSNGAGFVRQQQNETHMHTNEPTDALLREAREIEKLLGTAPRARYTLVGG